MFDDDDDVPSLVTVLMREGDAILYYEFVSCKDPVSQKKKKKLQRPWKIYVHQMEADNDLVPALNYAVMNSNMI